jgi:hypothetical protein
MADIQSRLLELMPWNVDDDGIRRERLAQLGTGRQHTQSRIGRNVKTYDAAVTSL